MADKHGDGAFREEDLRDLSIRVTFKSPDVEDSVDLFEKGFISAMAKAGAEYKLVLQNLQVFLEREK